MNKINAEIVAHSLSPQKDEVISILCTFPRIILAEVNTHRMLSKNTSSSRAIPFLKMVEAVKDNPFIPIAWQKDHKGMQGSEYSSGETLNSAVWLNARDEAVRAATALNQECGVTKQLANRLLEPFMWTTMLITGSREGWDNFFHLRCPQYFYDGNGKHYKSKKDMLKIVNEDLGSGNFPDDVWFILNKGAAEIHIMDLAEKIWDAVGESTPVQLKAGEWHIPFGDKFTEQAADDYLKGEMDMRKDGLWGSRLINKTRVKVSTAMGARTSYTIINDEKEINYQKMVGLHDTLLSQDPPHSSPLEHCQRAMTDDEYYRFIKGEGVALNNVDVSFETDCSGWCYNAKGFIPYRYMVDNNWGESRIFATPEN